MMLVRLPRQLTVSVSMTLFELGSSSCSEAPLGVAASRTMKRSPAVTRSVETRAAFAHADHVESAVGAQFVDANVYVAPPSVTPMSLYFMPGLADAIV